MSDVDRLKPVACLKSSHANVNKNHDWVLNNSEDIATVDEGTCADFSDIFLWAKYLAVMGDWNVVWCL